MFKEMFNKYDQNMIMFFIDGKPTPVEVVSFPDSQADNDHKQMELAMRLSAITEDIKYRYHVDAVTVKTLRTIDMSVMRN